MVLNGSLAGLVGITAGADVISPFSAIIVGFISGLLVYIFVVFFDKLKIDDPVGAISVHLILWSLGTLAVGIFSFEHSFIIQLLGVFAYGLASILFSFILFSLIKYLLVLEFMKMRK